MNIFTADIIIAIMLIAIGNNPILRLLQSTGLDFLTSEIIIGLIVIVLVFLIHKFILKKIM